jgi:hypothetical protein
MVVNTVAGDLAAQLLAQKPPQLEGEGKYEMGDGFYIYSHS